MDKERFIAKANASVMASLLLGEATDTIASLWIQMLIPQIAERPEIAQMPDDTPITFRTIFQRFDNLL